MTKHPKAGQTVKIASGQFAGQDYWIEDYWVNVAGASWMDTKGNPACLKYAVRCAEDNLPIDDLVLYGKIGFFGHLIHVSEIGE